MVLKTYKKLVAFIKWFLWDFSGLRFIWTKIWPPLEGTPPKRRPATFFLWAVGIYMAFFGVASQRYENRIDIIENRANAIFTQLSTPAFKNAISRVPAVQNMWCPEKPEILLPLTVFRSLFRKSKYDEMVNLLKETIEDWKESLDNVNLMNIDLRETQLDGANLQNTFMQESDLQHVFLIKANLQGVDMSISNLFGAQLIQANLRNAKLYSVNFRHANFTGANLEGAILAHADLQNTSLWLKAEQLCKAKSIYEAKLDKGVFEEILKLCPDLYYNPPPGW